ncbi:predicted protein [Botrytis cinerea T4]|uniref:Uncharacterized protein n=1 Tax=Botryotinia fuckeliana (strain T4) TaxID=999810 RepID=G2XP66_BOTF4|nr:predicted protein [Botrytis cinerea T4]
MATPNSPAIGSPTASNSFPSSPHSDPPPTRTRHGTRAEIRGGKPTPSPAPIDTTFAAQPAVAAQWRWWHLPPELQKL